MREVPILEKQNSFTSTFRPYLRAIIRISSTINRKNSFNEVSCYKRIAIVVEGHEFDFLAGSRWGDVGEMHPPPPAIFKNVVDNIQFVHSFEPLRRQ